MLRKIFGLALICFLAGPLAAQETGKADLDPALEKEAKELENLIIAPCCWRQPVAVHFSPAADQIRKDVRKMLASGMSREEILDIYVDEYGEKILAKPRASGFNILAYILPVIFLIAGAGVAYLAIRRLRPAAQADSPAPEAAATAGTGAPDRARLEKEMWG